MNDCGVGPEIMLGLSGVAVPNRINGKCAEGTFLDLEGLSGLVGFAGFLVELVRERKGPKTVLGKNSVNEVDGRDGGSNASEKGGEP